MITCTGVALAQGGKAAAETILDMRATGDFSRQSTKEYDFHLVCAASAVPLTPYYGA